MYDAIAQASTTWGRVENAMAGFFEALLGWSSEHEALYIYFAPNNAETRFKIVDTIARLRWDNYQQHDLKGEWTAIMTALNRAKDTRNRIVHGQIEGPERKIHGKWVPQARLVASSLDVSRRRLDPPNQWPGMSVHDVDGAANRFFWLAVRIEECRRYREAQVGQTAALQDIFARIIERRQNSGPLSSDQNPQE